MEAAVEALVVSALVLLMLFFLLYIIGSNCISILRNGLYIPVNCWFCNKNNKVLFANRNSFECAFCQQYNGFNKNGDYNKMIKAQYDFSENCVQYAEYKSIQPCSNGLCNYCNNNQQLKIFQLANFVPLNENNYDVEVEHFEKQLENAYKLCEICSRVVKAKIRWQNAWLFGNRIKDLKVLRNRFSYMTDSNTVSFYVKMIHYSLLICAGVAIGLLIEKNICTKQRLKNILSNHLKPHLVFLLDSFNSWLKDFYSFDHSIKFLKKYLPKNLDFHVNELFSLSLFGFFLQMISITFSTSISNLSKVDEVISWVMLLLTSGFIFPQKYVAFIDTVQIFCCLWLIYSSGSAAKKGSSKKTFSIKKLSRNKDDNYHLDNESKNIMDYYKPMNKTETAIIDRLNRSFYSEKIPKTDILHNSIKNDFKGHNCHDPSKTGLNSQFNLLNIGGYSSDSRSFSSPTLLKNTEGNTTFSANPFLTHNVISHNKYGYQVLPSNGFYRSPTELFCQSTSGNLFLGRSQLFSPAPLSSQNHSYSVPRYTFSGFSKHLDNNGLLSVNSNRHSFNSTPVSFSPNETKENARQSQFSSPANDYFLGSSKCAPNNFYSSSEPRNFLNNSISSNCCRSTSPCSSLYKSVLSQDKVRSPTFGTPESVKSFGYTFRPLSPQSCVESNRSILSPSKFNSCLSENISNSCAGSTTTQYLPNTGIFEQKNVQRNKVISSVNSFNNRELHLGAKHAIFSCNVHINGNNGKLNSSIESASNIPRDNSGSSRSSSRSSGFISSNELPNKQSFSLPGSRSHSPERNSLFSEPPYHLKLD